ncbi:MAG: isoaspartyl peptidase/L-asparaginase [Xanthomonadales bacterium]|nr:isoaspartyl peptidase/L-asparaginase [Xanthomonadales bacterium]
MRLAAGLFVMATIALAPVPVFAGDSEPTAVAGQGEALAQTPQVAASGPIAIAVHGGAGGVAREALSEERRVAVNAALRQALAVGHAVLADGGSSVDAVAATVVVLEESPYFNAGKGAVFNADGDNELDAAIMDGATRNAGAVAALRRVRNPVLLARAVMDESPHVFMIGSGAERFAREQGLELVNPRWFRTDDSWSRFQQARRQQAAIAQPLPDEAYYGTVGAVALDRNGHVAAATSTGGMTMKRYGRVGDVPVIGAGTWADADCAVSATGWGEFFIRTAAAHEICSRVRLAGQSLSEAADGVVMDEIPALGGSGGVIAIDSQGNLVMPYSSISMFRGSIDAGGTVRTAIWAEDES